MRYFVYNCGKQTTTFPYLKIEGKGQGRLKNLLKFLKQSWDWKPGGVVPGEVDFAV